MSIILKDHVKDRLCRFRRIPSVLLTISVQSLHLYGKHDKLYSSKLTINIFHSSQIIRSRENLRRISFSAFRSTLKSGPISTSYLASQTACQKFFSGFRAVSGAFLICIYMWKTYGIGFIHFPEGRKIGFF